MVKGREVGAGGLALMAVAGLVGGCVNGPAMRLMTSAVGYQGVRAAFNHEGNGGQGLQAPSIVIRGWYDGDKDKSFDDSTIHKELLGDVGGSVNLSGLGIFFYLPNLTKASINYEILDSAGDAVVQYTSSRGVLLHRGGLVAGDYTITANGRKPRKITVTR